jgi:hypothetical protein
MVETCPCCGHPVPPKGVRRSLTVQYTRLFDAVEAAGRYGITRARLMDQVYAHRPHGANDLNVLNVMRARMAPRLAAYGLQIVTHRDFGDGARWRLEAISPAPPPPLPTGTRAFPARG